MLSSWQLEGCGSATCSAFCGLVLLIRYCRSLFILLPWERKANGGLRCAFRRTVQALDALKILPFLDPVLISAQEGIEKPAAAIYLRACERAQVDPAETLHVGDELQA